MKDFHLLGKEILQPFVFLDVIMDELDGQSPCNLNGTFAFFSSVEPCLGPPNDAVSVWIDADGSLNVEALNVYLKVCQRVENALAL